MSPDFFSALLTLSVWHAQGPLQRTHVDTIGRTETAETATESQLYRAAHDYIMSACIKSGGALETADSTTGVIVVNGITAVRALNPAWAGQYYWHLRLHQHPAQQMGTLAQAIAAS